MTSRERLFLVLAEELNFSRAAQKSFVSQQCLSDHIKKLEEDYGTKLFSRRPTVELTEAGKAVQRVLLTVKNLEQGLQNELEEIENGASGTLRFGVSHIRAKILLPNLIAEYRKKYPNVKVEVVLEETRNMQKMLTKGQLDFFLGVRANCDHPMKMMPLSSESIYVMATGSYLKRFAGIDVSTLKNAITIIDIKDFQGLPFSTNARISTMSQLVQQHLTACNVTLDTVLLLSDHGITEQVCRSGRIASFCSQIFVPTILEQNKRCSEEERLYVLPVKGLERALHTELVYNGMIHYPRYVLDFFEGVKSAMREQVERMSALEG